MPKSQFIDPSEVRKAGEITFNPIPVNQYNKTVEEEKANFTVVLADSGTQKIAVIKALREINQELGLKEAKDLADNPPKEIKKDIPKKDAEEAKKKLEAAGAKVELR